MHERGDLLVLFPGEPVLADVCVTHPLADSHVAGAAKADGASAKKSEAHKREKYGRSGAGAFPCVPVAHETYGRVGPAAFAFLNRIADAAASSGAVSRRVFLENAMRDISVTLCHRVARQGFRPPRGEVGGETRSCGACGPAG